MPGELPLSLERYYFNKVVVEAAPSRPGENVQASLNLSVGLTGNRENPNRFRLRMQLDLVPAEGVAGKVAYQGSVVLTGWFAVDPVHVSDKEGKEALVKLEGAPMLYSAAREMIASITSRGRWKPFVALPVMSFRFLLDEVPTAELVPDEVEG